MHVHVQAFEGFTMLTSSWRFVPVGLYESNENLKVQLLWSKIKKKCWTLKKTNSLCVSVLKADTGTYGARLDYHRDKGPKVPLMTVGICNLIDFRSLTLGSNQYYNNNRSKQPQAPQKHQFNSSTHKFTNNNRQTFTFIKAWHELKKNPHPLSFSSCIVFNSISRQFCFKLNVSSFLEDLSVFLL